MQVLLHAVAVRRTEEDHRPKGRGQAGESGVAVVCRGVVRGRRHSDAIESLFPRRNELRQFPLPRGGPAGDSDASASLR